MSAKTDYASRSNNALLTMARQGNEEAFSEIVRRNSQKIYRISRKVLRNHEDAEDTRQNVLVKVYQRLHALQQSSRFSSWLFRVTFNEALMTLRRNRSRHQDNCIDITSVDTGSHRRAELQDAHSNNERKHINRELASKAMLRLNPSLRRAFLLHKAQGWTHQEVAEELGITQATAKTRVFRACRQLRQELAVLTR